MKKAIIIGSGIAGLASALRLRHKGYLVTIFEANSYPGGKLHAFNVNGYQFDYGPSLFTMPHLVTALFELFNLKSENYFQYIQKDTICNYFWEDGTRFQANKDQEKFIKQASSNFAEPEKNIRSYLDNSALKYDRTATIFLEKSLHKLDSYLSKDTIRSILSISKLGLFNTLNDTNKNYLNNPKLIQFFNRFATYNGSDPYQTPGIMSLIPQLEMRFGTYYPKGGMHAITNSLVQLAEKKGVSFHLNEKVDEILVEKKTARRVVTKKGEYGADLVICNMDVFSAYQSILKKAKKPKRVLSQERSSSALIFYWGVKRSFPELDLHNIFFSNNYKTEFEHIFKKKSLYDDPTIYINITSKEESSHAPNNCENWFVMVNVPSNSGQDWPSLKTKAKNNILKKLSRLLDDDISSLIEEEIIVDPVRIERDTLSHQGSLYGTSSNSQFAAFLRHPNFSKDIKNLYFCGGSTHPGGGIPLCLLSAKIVSDLIPIA